MNSLIQLKTTALLTTIALAMVMGTAAWAAQIGDEVHSTVALTDGVQLTSNSPAVITAIILDDGVWEINGQINFSHSNLQLGTVYDAGAIDIGVFGNTGGDGLTLITSQRLTAPTNNIIQGLSLPSRAADINGNGVPVFLVAWTLTLQPLQPSHCVTWGFISAHKIRNNH